MLVIPVNAKITPCTHTEFNAHYVNLIAKIAKEARSSSKAPTFALTYQGTFATLMTNCGFTIQKAKQIEKAYHDLYKVSDQWVASKLNQASIDGYVTVAFGLRLRTPMLAQVIRGNSRTPHLAEAEGRTAGNALGQSWGLLNTRASIEFMGKVRKSDFRLAIQPCNAIHDALYHIVDNNAETVAYANKHLVAAMSWQDHPDIYHDKVKLSGSLAIFYPNWSKELSIPKVATAEQITSICRGYNA